MHRAAWEERTEVTRARRHLKSAGFLTFSQAGTRLLSFLSIILIQKNVSVADNGLFQLGLRLAFLLSLFTEFGIRGYVVREVARHREDAAAAQRIFGNVLNLRLALVGPVWVVGAAILWWAGYPKGTIAVIGLFYLFTVADSFAILFKYLFRAYDRMEFDAYFSVLGRTLLLLGLLGLWHLHSLTVPRIAYVHIAAASTEALLLAFCILWILRLRILHPWDSAGILLALRRSVPFAVINIIGTLYMSTGTIALSKLLGEEAVGYYNAASRLPEALQFLPTAVVNALIPFLARHHNERDLVSRYYRILVQYLGYCALMGAAVFLFVAEWVIRVVAKEEYLKAASVFRYYGVWLVLVYYQIIAANILICLDAEKVVMARALLVLVINVVLNVIGIRIWGLNGAALALVTSESLSVLLYYIALSRRRVSLSLQAWGRLATVFILTALPMIALNTLVPDVLRVAAGLGCGILASAYFSWVDDRSLLASIVRRK